MMWVCCSYCTGESSSEVASEADSNGITERLQDDKSRPVHSCTQCEKRFTSQQYLKEHMKVHSSKYKCTDCGKCYRNNQALTVHRRNHSGEKPFECTVCRKRFAQSANLVVHSRIHSGDKPYKCSQCDKAFSVSGDLKNT